MNLSKLTPEEGKNLKTRDGRAVRVTYDYGDGFVLVKANRVKLPYRVRYDGSARSDGILSDDDVFLSGTRKIRVYLYEDGKSAWHYLGTRAPQSKKKVISTLSGEL